MDFYFFGKVTGEGQERYENCTSLEIFSNGFVHFARFLYILGTFISQNTFQQQPLTVLISVENVYVHKSYAFRTGGQGLKKFKTLSVSNGNLIVLKQQNIQFNYKIMLFQPYNSCIQYVVIYSNISPRAYLYIQYVINFEINHFFPIKLFFYVTKKSRQKFEYVENERHFSSFLNGFH